MNLRPHHALCIHFFEGKGYSENFVRNMKAVIAVLENSPLTLSLSCDEICSACPHNVLGSCSSADKVRGFDKAVLSLTGLHEGDTITWKELSSTVGDEILSKGRLHDVCGECQWYSDICEKADPL